MLLVNDVNYILFPLFLIVYPVLEPPYQPMFDMPDYKNIGQILSTAMLPYHFEDAPVYDSEQGDVLLVTESYKLLLPELGLSVCSLWLIHNVCSHVYNVITEDDDPLRPMGPSSELVLSESGPVLHATRTGVARKPVAMSSTTSKSRTLPVTKPVSRPPATMKITAPFGPGAKKLSSSRKDVSIPISQAPSTAVTTTSAVARNNTAPGQRYASTSTAARNRSAMTTPSVGSAVLRGSGTNNPKNNASTLSSRRPTTTSSICRRDAASSTVVPRIPGTNLRPTPAVSVRGGSKAKSPVDEEVLLFKFDAMAGDGVEDFKFIV